MHVIAFDWGQSDADKATEQITYDITPPMIRTRPHAVAIFQEGSVVKNVAAQLSMFSSEAPRASPSRSPDFVRDWLTLAETSASPSLQSLTDIVPSGFSGRMSPASCRVTEDGILVPSSGDWGSSGMGGVTGFSMRNMSEWTAMSGPSRSDDGVCSLSDILETTAVPLRYYLSAKACRGILRRADRRGKELPPMLFRALFQVAEG